MFKNSRRGSQVQGFDEEKQHKEHCLNLSQAIENKGINYSLCVTLNQINYS